MSKWDGMVINIYEEEKKIGKNNKRDKRKKEKNLKNQVDF